MVLYETGINLQLIEGMCFTQNWRNNISNYANLISGQSDQQEQFFEDRQLTRTLLPDHPI